MSTKARVSRVGIPWRSYSIPLMVIMSLRDDEAFFRAFHNDLVSAHSGRFVAIRDQVVLASYVSIEAAREKIGLEVPPQTFIGLVGLVCREQTLIRANRSNMVAMMDLLLSTSLVRTSKPCSERSSQ